MERKKVKTLKRLEIELLSDAVNYHSIPPAVRHAIAEKWKNEHWASDTYSDDIDFSDSDLNSDEPDETRDLHYDKPDFSDGNSFEGRLSEEQSSILQKELASFFPDYQKVRLVDVDHFKSRVERESAAYHQGSNNNKGQSQIMSLTSLVEEKDLLPVTAKVFDDLAILKLEMPNFAAALDDLIIPCLNARFLGGDHAQLPQIIFDGPPGVGKTRFAKRLGEALKIPVQVYQTSNGDLMKITGLRSSWNGSRPGDIVAAMAESKIANQIMFWDEIDKIPVGSYGRGGSIYDVLLTLTEPESAKDFRDEYLDGVPIDMSYNSTIATSNDASLIPDALLSRFRTVNIAMPGENEMQALIMSVFHDVLNGASYGKFFAEELSDDVIAALIESTTSARAISNILSSALWKKLSGVSINDKKFGLTLTVDDLVLPVKKRVFMGFSG